MFRNRIKQDDAEKLLGALKKSLSTHINFPEKGTSETFQVKSIEGNDIFKINIYRGNVNRFKYNIGALISKDSIPLLELHIGPGNRHINPDGEIIEGSHWHIYSEQYGTSQAFPAEDMNSERFVENTISFLDRFNVIEKPEIYYQSELT